MAKYEVLQLLWSPSNNAYIVPGAVINLADDDPITRVLLDKLCIKPAGFPGRSKKVEGVRNDTNNG